MAYKNRRAEIREAVVDALFSRGVWIEETFQGTFEIVKSDFLPSEWLDENTLGPYALTHVKKRLLRFYRLREAIKDGRYLLSKSLTIYYIRMFNEVRYQLFPEEQIALIQPEGEVE